MDAGGDDALVRCRDPVKRLGVLARDHLGYSRQGVLAVARVDAFRRVRDAEIETGTEPGCSFQRRCADLLGRAGVDGGLIDDDRPLLQDAADEGGGAQQCREVRSIVAVDWRGNSNHQEATLDEVLDGRSEAEGR